MEAAVDHKEGIIADAEQGGACVVSTLEVLPGCIRKNNARMARSNM